MQTIEETLLANRKTKEKNAPSKQPNTPLSQLLLQNFRTSTSSRHF
jgi:hypothetical protein